MTCYVRTEWDPGSMESKNWSRDKKIAKSKGDHMQGFSGMQRAVIPSPADVLMYPFTSLSLQARGARVCKGLPLPARERGRAPTSCGPLEGSSYLYHPARIHRMSRIRRLPHRLSTDLLCSGTVVSGIKENRRRS
ncbi:uncharacterized protein MCYG_01489 [Microsporum canis CBS 113480]|uniref:Uncharacterized protein n=1 Tax=Arthroderma otae (strain ATCC MYA-4605 / CBS 113480) TaxID=554155 RepID=C5FH40_ARTOC|nr:uncharacterized protein MCYG_01489 [Microsporum canis CBS 113480]EEQ28670.1 predicted protein [Microsporum canis CBS 113480]